MKLSKIVTQLMLIAVIVGAGACNDFLDVNEDPTAPNQVPENLQLSGLLGNFSYEVIGNTPARTTTQWVQQTSYNGVPPSADNYDVNSSDVNNLWNASYIDVMNSATGLNELATQNGNFAYAGIAKVILAWNIAIITDLWGDAPYTEAFDPSISTPAYDSQEEIYSTIFDLLNSALNDFGQPSPQSPGNDDLLYGGDMAKWEKLTHTLIARFNLHLTNAPGYDATEQANAALAALQNGFESNADDADFQYFDTAGQENPWYQFVIDGKWDTRNQLSNHHVSLLQSLNDPRLAIQARPVGAVDGQGLVAGFDGSNPVYEGHDNGEEGVGAVNISSIGLFYSAPDAPLNWISYAEAKFIEAEATLITSGATAAQPIYIEGITASMDKLGVEDTEAAIYIASLPLLAVSANALEEIIRQKYIANFLKFEAYNDWRRTGYPEIEPVTNQVQTPSGIIPLRFPYPDSELQNNASNVSDTGIPGGFPALEVPVWWDQN
ncbi:SusD/RagB family nutrient-binding outer membrane lipoprotein [Fodinibius salsisoli]|uniref:SusD/RagB family nutrient-binding outer membrane lipoprotein n=1 Tax=Fodinibius salsisoli TaxID=2820877 RepID=A0ABT3PJ93_9BACT|nr:SusD/RagB family nutrient-binding outer membrane lipoprotein [Fodinibius salsisoli]MCW9705974.1 SusD/RagB family nutrient-binding outer membrane lipoprotein [Fodinibius salsisoli]